MVDSDKVIDNQFVTFKSIQEMHAKHGQLLRVLRELGARQERTDSLDKEMSILNSRLEDARNQLSEVQISRQRQATLIESLLRQRDTLRMACVTQNQPTDVLSINDHLLPENSNVNYSPELVSGEIQYHALRDESEYEIGREESKRVEENLLQRVNQLQSEMIAKNGRIAILEASLAMSAERLKLWKENEKGIREELNVIRHSYSGMMEANAKLQCSNQSLLDDLIQSRADLGEFKQQTSSLRANLNVSQEEVGRLGKEILNLRSDREKLSELISSLKNQYLSRNEQDDRVPALRSQLEITERELQVARSRIHDSSELIRSSQQAHEREYRELVLRHDELQKEHRQLLEKINMIEHTRLTSNKVDESSPYEVGVSNENLVQGYRLRLDSLTEEILSLKKLLDESTGQADYYRKELEEVTKCLAISKKESDERMAKLSEKASLADSIDSLKAQHAEDILRADKERLLLQDRVALFDEMIQTLQSIGFTGLNSASDLANTLSEANSRFEEEHSLRVKISLELDDLKIKAEDFQKQLHDTASQVDEWKMKCSGLDAELGAIKTVHQSVIEERVEIERQNSGLISRLESLVSSTGSGDVNTSDAATKDLMETISFLRKRKDALQVEHDKLGLEYRRLKVTHVKLQQSIEANEKGEGNQQDIINKSQEYEQTISRLNIVNDTLKTANDDLIEQCRQLRTQINNVLSERSRDEERLSALQVRIAALGHFGEMEGKLEESESKASNLEAELSESKRCCESLEIEIKHLQKNEALATDELSKLKSLFKTTNTELNQSKEAHQTVLNDLLQLRQLHGTCEHELEKLKAERDSLIDELKDAKESDAGALNIDQIKEQLTQSEAKFKRLLLQTQSIAAARNDLVKKVKDFEAQLTERNAACEGLAVKVSQLESQLTDALDRITNLQSRTEPVTVRDDSIIAEKDEQILQLTARIERYSEALKRFAKIRDNYKECNARLRGAVEQIEGYESRIEEMKKEHDLRCQLLTSTWQARLDRLVNSGGDNGTQKQSFGQVVHGALSSGHIRGNGVSDSGEKASKSISNQNVNQIPSVDSNGLVDEFNLGQDVENENNVDSVVSLKSSVKESKGTRQKQLIPHEVVPSGEPSYFFAEESPFLDSGNHGMDFLHSNKLKPELNSTLIPSKRLAYNDERFGSEIGSPNADEDVELGGSKVPNAPLELDSFDTLNNSVINESSSAQFVIIPQTLEPNFSPLHAKLTDKIEETDAKTLQSSVNNNEEKFVHESFEAKSSSSCLRPHDDGSEGSTTVELEVRSNLVESKLNDSKLEISSPKSKDSEGQLEIKKNIKFENFIDKKPIMMQSCKDEEFDKADDGDIQLVGMKRVQEVIEQRSVLRKDLPSLSMSNVLFSSSVDESRKESVDEGNISPRDI